LAPRRISRSSHGPPSWRLGAFVSLYLWHWRCASSSRLPRAQGLPALFALRLESRFVLARDLVSGASSGRSLRDPRWRGPGRQVASRGGGGPALAYYLGAHGGGGVRSKPGAAPGPWPPSNLAHVGLRGGRQRRSQRVRGSDKPQHTTFGDSTAFGSSVSRGFGHMRARSHSNHNPHSTTQWTTLSFG